MIVDDKGNITIGNNEIVIGNIVNVNTKVKKRTVNVNTKTNDNFWENIEKTVEKCKSINNTKESECEKCKWYDMSKNGKTIKKGNTTIVMTGNSGICTKENIKSMSMYGDKMVCSEYEEKENV